MHMDRLSKGEWISAGSAVLLFVFMFFRWYGLGVDERPPLLFDLQLFEDGGNAWQTLDVIPIFLALVIAVALGAAARRLLGRDWELPVSPGALVCGLGVIAACLILIRIIFPPDLGGEFDGFTFSATLEVGIFVALIAACGIAYGGRQSMREEGVTFADLRLLRR